MKIAEYRFFKEAKGITNNSNHVKKDYVLFYLQVCQPNIGENFRTSKNLRILV